MTVRPPLTNPLKMVRQMQDACCKCVKPLSYLKGKSARLRHNKKKNDHSPKTHDLKLDLWPSLYGGMSPHSLTHARVH